MCLRRYTSIGQVHSPFQQVIPYWIAQMLGGFFSAVMLYAVYVGTWQSYSCVYTLEPLNVDSLTPW